MVIVISSIMSYLQRERFDDIRNVRSFDAVFEGDRLEELKSLFTDKSIFKYGESEALVDGKAFFVRFIDESYDGGIRILGGSDEGLLYPYSVYNPKKSVSMVMLRSGRSTLLLPRTERVEISGYYASRMGSDFDESYIFLPYEMADDSVSVKTAIKGLGDKELKELRSNGYEFTSWKESEASLYSAFSLENGMMYIVLSLLFVMIAVSIRGSVRIFYDAKRKERASLMILGLSRRDTEASFVLSFLIVASLGVFLSLLFSYFFLFVAEKASYFTIYGTMDLIFPVGPFLVFSSFVVFVSFVFSYIEAVKGRKKSLLEIVYG